MAAPKLGLDETMELLSRILGAGDEDGSHNVKCIVLWVAAWCIGGKIAQEMVLSWVVVLKNFLICNSVDAVSYPPRVIVSLVPIKVIHRP